MRVNRRLTNQAPSESYSLAIDTGMAGNKFSLDVCLEITNSEEETTIPEPLDVSVTGIREKACAAVDAAELQLLPNSSSGSTKG